MKQVQDSPLLKTLLFRNVKGLKWFGLLSDAGHFEPSNIPKPIQSKQDEYITIPNWPLTDYLVKTAAEINEENAPEYVPKFLEIIISSTNYAKEHKFSNHHVWRRFAEILAVFPSNQIQVDKLNVIDYWLYDRFDCGMVADVIGNNWLYRLLKETNEHSCLLASKVLTILFSVEFQENEYAGRSKWEAKLIGADPKGNKGRRVARETVNEL